MPFRGAPSSSCWISERCRPCSATRYWWFGWKGLDEPAQCASTGGRAPLCRRPWPPPEHVTAVLERGEQTVDRDEHDDCATDPPQPSMPPVSVREWPPRVRSGLP